MATPAAVLQILVTANSAQAVTGLQAVDTQARRTAATTSTSTSRISSGFSRMASVAKTALIGGVAYGLYSGVKAGIDFEKQMDAVGAVADANRKQMKKLEDQALRLGQRTAFSASEAAQAQEELAKGGLKTSDILSGALKASLSLAAAGELDLADAASTTVNAMKLFNLRGRKASQVADMLATAANTTTADVEDFAMALRQGGSAAQAAGYDLNQTMVVLEALAEAGIKNSDAGTSMKTAFLQLLAPTDKQRQLAEQLNIQWVNQQGNLKSAAGLSRELQGALGGMTNAQQAANLKVLAGTDGFRTLNALLDAGPAKLRKLAQANAEQGTAQEIAKKKMDNTAGSIEQLRGAWETLSIELFKRAQSPFRSIIDSMTEAVQKFTDVITDKRLTSEEKLSRVMQMIVDGIGNLIPKVASAGAKVGAAIMRGIADAFIHGSILTKLFIGASAIRLFGGAGVFGRLGATIAQKIAAGLSLKLGATTLFGKLAGNLTMPGYTIARPLYVSVVNGFPGGGPGGPVPTGTPKTVGQRLGDVGKWLPALATRASVVAAPIVIAETIRAIRGDWLEKPFKDWSQGMKDGVRAMRELNAGAAGRIRAGISGLDVRGARGLEKTAELARNVGVVVASSLGKARKGFTDASVGAAAFARNLAGKVTASAEITRANMKGVGERVRETGGDFRLFANDTGKFLDKSKAEMRKFQDVVDNVKGRVGDDIGDMGKDVLDFAGKANKGSDRSSNAFRGLSQKAKAAFGQVGRNTLAAATTVTRGLQTIIDNTNKSLQGFGVKKIGISLAKVGEAAKGFQHGGAIYPVPGFGTGDKVPAMLEPGEVVVNRKAVAAMGGANRVNRINELIPRFAGGGVVPGDTGGLHPAILNFVSGLYHRFGGSVSSGLRAGDSGSLHSTGQAADYVPGNWQAAAAAVNRSGPSLLEGIYNPAVHGGSAVSWDTGNQVSHSYWEEEWGNHLDHIHLAIADGTKVAAAAAVKSIKRIMLKGPDGPLKDIGQAALDKVRSAANKFIAAKTKTDAIGDIGAPVKGAIKVGETIGGKVSYFTPGVGAYGFGPGPGVALNPWPPGGWNDPRITSLAGHDWRIKIGNHSAVLPLIDKGPAIDGRVIDVTTPGVLKLGMDPSSFPTDSYGTATLLNQRGGIVGFQTGGKPGKDGKKDKTGKGAFEPGPADVAWKRLTRAQRIRDKLRDLLSERGQIARIDERIASAESWASQESSPLGSELSATEIAKQVRLNELLLSKLVMARKLARTGVGLTDVGKLKGDRKTLKGLKRLHGAFATDMLDLVGLTGKAGRIGETRLTLDTLKHTTSAAATSTALDIAGLRDVIEAARYGVFDGTFAKGGQIKPGHWGIAGERGPEIVRGPASVHPAAAAPQVSVHNSFDFDGFDLVVTTTVNGEIAKRERIEHRRSGQYARWA